VWPAALRNSDLSVDEREEIYWALHDYFRRRGSRVTRRLKRAGGRHSTVRRWASWVLADDPQARRRVRSNRALRAGRSEAAVGKGGRHEKGALPEQLACHKLTAGWVAAERSASWESGPDFFAGLSDIAVIRGPASVDENDHSRLLAPSAVTLAVAQPRHLRPRRRTARSGGYWIIRHLPAPDARSSKAVNRCFLPAANSASICELLLSRDPETGGSGCARYDGR